MKYTGLFLSTTAWHLLHTKHSQLGSVQYHHVYATQLNPLSPWKGGCDSIQSQSINQSINQSVFTCSWPVHDKSHLMTLSKLSWLAHTPWCGFTHLISVFCRTGSLFLSVEFLCECVWILQHGWYVLRDISADISAGFPIHKCICRSQPQYQHWLPHIDFPFLSYAACSLFLKYKWHRHVRATSPNPVFGMSRLYPDWFEDCCKSHPFLVWRRCEMWLESDFCRFVSVRTLWPLISDFFCVTQRDSQWQHQNQREWERTESSNNHLWRYAVRDKSDSPALYTQL